MSRPDRPTVAIAGGGPAGAVAALVLARRGLRPVVLEPADPAGAGGRKAGETLPPSLLPLLRRLGLDGALARGGHVRSQGNRSYWGSDTPAESPFLANPYGAGWHVDRQRFETTLRRAARSAGATWRAEGVRGVESTGGGWRLALTGAGPGLDADFVMDATGRPARVARRLGARRVRYDRLMGVHGVLRSEAPCPEAYTQVEAVEDGWWYSATLPDGGLAVCFFSDADLLGRPLLRAEPRAWQARLQGAPATRERVERYRYRAGGPPRVLPCESSRLDRLIGERWIALGDAAAAYDPLSSHGVASAMGSAFYGAHAVADLLAGRPEAGLAYRALMQEAYCGYLEQWAAHYARETRWPKAPFWRRRQAGRFAVAA